jgi:hypothetical protein
MSFRRSAILAGAAIALAAAPASAQDVASKLSIHGYLTQAYAIADTLQFAGIDDQGTADYRRAALLFRYAADANDAVVVQLAHRELGQSPTTRFDNSINLDWAFYEHRFSTDTRIRVGKAPIPFGIYNETRYIGTLQPFYRAPYSFYLEGIYTSETVDGAVVTQRLFADKPLNVELSVYGGEFRYLEVTGGAEYDVMQARARKAVGGQLWINTPLEGVRLGGGAFRYTSDNTPVSEPGADQTVKGWHASLDATRERFFVRGEYRSFWYPVQTVRAIDVNNWYAQAGVKATEQLSVNLQYEGSKLGILTPTAAIDKSGKDFAAGVNYAFTPALVLKVEAHHAEGFNYEDPRAFVPGTQLESNYTIASISASF